MATHDPRKVLETLRSHLTQPETNVAFLLGAGTSCAVRVRVPANGELAQDGAPPTTRSLIPNVAELTAIAEKEIRKLDPDGEVKRFGLAFDSIEAEIRPTGRATNIEDILSCVRRKLYAVGEGDSLAGLGKAELARFEKTIRGTIAAQVNPDRSSFPERLPHEDFVRWIARMPRAHPVEIFTTNYDILVETALEAERVAAFDGFVGCNQPFFSHESLTRPESAPGSAWTRLWKIHGSINWKLDTVRGKTRVIRTEPHNEGEMILPSHHKYDESRKQPYSAFLERLTRVLDRDDAILFACGYSFTTIAARVLDRSERQVQRIVERASLGADDLARIAGTSLDSGTEIDLLLKLSPEERAKLIDRAAAGEIVSAVSNPAPATPSSDPAAQPAATPGDNPSTELGEKVETAAEAINTSPRELPTGTDAQPYHDGTRALMDAWRAASEPERMAFLAWVTAAASSTAATA